MLRRALGVAWRLRPTMPVLCVQMGLGKTLQVKALWRNGDGFRECRALARYLHCGSRR